MRDTDNIFDTIDPDDNFFEDVFASMNQSDHSRYYDIDQFNSA